jgi:hypothetical protein
MQVIHTAGVPPSRGSTILENMGWTKKSSKALTNNEMANSISKVGDLSFKIRGAFNISINRGPGYAIMAFEE